MCACIVQSHVTERVPAQQIVFIRLAVTVCPSSFHILQSRSNPFRTRFRPRDKSVHVTLNRILLRLIELEVEAPKRRRESNEQIRIGKLPSHARACSFPECDHVRRERLTIWSAWITKPSLGLVREAVGEDCFVVRNAVIVHADDDALR